jgi:TonB family protein
VARWDSPLALATAGTLAAHLILIVAADAVAITHPLRLDPPAPHVKLIDIQVHRRQPTLPHREEPRPRPAIQPTEPVKSHVATPTPHRVQAAAPPASQPVEPPATSSPSAGGNGPVVTMDDIAPAATGVPVGKLAGGGGKGAGPGTGSGTGTGTGTRDGTQPVSVATIKQLALPKRDYGYVLSKDYPPEARRLGIEGTLKVRLVVDSSGKVTSATLLDSLGHGLDELALAQARSFEFTPARDESDRPVTSVVVWTFRMTPPK